MSRNVDRKRVERLVREWAHALIVRESPLDLWATAYDESERKYMVAERERILKALAGSHTHRMATSSAKQDWLTPPFFLDIVRSFAPISFDPCANPYSFVRAWQGLYYPQVDGLSIRWYTPANTVCFVNPPYGRTLALWAAKMASDGSSIIANANAHLIGLIPARTGTGYWEKFIWPFADAVCFWNGGTKHPSRMCFYNLDGKPADTGATFDAAVVYFGRDKERFKNVFGEYGTVQLIN